MTRFVSMTLALLGVTALAGCSSEAKPLELKGAVTVNTQMLKTGRIRFTPADDKSTPAEATIIDGKYATTILPGLYKVEIYSPQPSGKKRDVPGPGAEEMVMIESIPRRYNASTELTLEVTKDLKEKDFPLTSP